MPLLLLLLFIACSFTLNAQDSPMQTVPLLHGHAHNDYAKRRVPLITALNYGFTSIEVDVFPYKKELKVAHIPLFLGARQSLEEMYFKPLDNWLRTHNGHCFEDTTVQLILMIDIKRNANEAYSLLREICRKYKWVTHRYATLDSLVRQPVKIIMSGAKPYKSVLEDSLQYLFLDGSFQDIDNPDFNAVLLPRVSTSFRSYFKWRGRGPLSEEAFEALSSLVNRAHAQGRKVRFWGMPNKEIVWETLLKAGVDWMNVDNLTKFQTFYLKLKNKY